MDRHTDKATGEGAARSPDVGELLQEIGRDMKTIARHELELVRNKVAQHVEQTITKAAAVWLGATVALIGLAMLCVVVVVALAPLLPPLWLRLLVMAVVYIVLGGTVAGVFGARLAKNLMPDLSEPIAELKRTARSVEEGLTG
jgi:uncharacterized membrane protein YqjE